MIGKLKGKIDTLGKDYLLLDVNGVCYIVLCSGNTLSKVNIGSDAELLIEPQIREDAFNLYGFLTQEEKNAFIHLTSVKGVGNKMALNILTHIDPQALLIAIHSKDKEVFKPISGVGSKLAERILVELNNTELNLGDYSQKSNLDHSTNVQATPQENKISDALAALEALGVDKSTAYQNVYSLIQQTPEINLDELIRQTLKNITRV